MPAFDKTLPFPGGGGGGKDTYVCRPGNAERVGTGYPAGAGAAKGKNGIATSKYDPSPRRIV